MAKRHLTKDEIMESLRQQKRAKLTAKHTTPMIMSTMMMYVLHKFERFSTNELIKFQDYMIEHFNDDVEEANNLIWDKAGFKIELEDNQSMRIKKTGNQFWDNLNQNINDYDYSIYAYAHVYISIALAYLIKYKGFGKKRLTRVKDEMNHMVNEEGYCNIAEIRKYLLDNAGIATTTNIAEVVG